ncbi:MAG: hypothetical protein ACFFFH_06975 [Candidatus Thorarchaeota archaeon]
MSKTGLTAVEIFMSLYKKGLDRIGNKKGSFTNYSLRLTTPVSYMGTGVPSNRPGGGSAHSRMGV